MSDPITDRTAQLLNHSEFGLVPLSELYRMLTNEGLMPWIDMDAFSWLIGTDSRFEIVDGLRDIDLLDEDVQFELEMRGLLGGPRVMLRSRKVPPEVVILDLLHQLHDMNAALEEAWNMRPQNDPEVEAELVNLLMMGDMLERELLHVLQVDKLLDVLSLYEQTHELE
ncbi:MAG: hypothetical protein JXA33_25255 [Anaerolineae bacterium]|nr:hypothetical protein [Anaerolineae bacterium]